MSFISAAASGLGVTILAELGDKTFFVCALLAAKGDKTAVFLGSYAALVIQTLVCILLAVLFSAKARSLETESLRWDLIIGGSCLLFFGSTAIHEALTTTTLAEEQDMPNLDQMLNELLTDDPLMLEITPNTSDVLDHVVQKQVASSKNQYISQDVYVDLDADPPSTTADTNWLQAGAPWNKRRLSLDSNNPIAMKALSEAASLIQEANWSSPLFQAFGAVFAAELGDRSMFSTIALGATADPLGVLFGVLLGHCLVTLFAVSCASVVCRYLSQKTASICAGVLFLGFGFMSLWQAASIFLASS